MAKLSSLLAGMMKSKSTKRKEEYARYRNTYLRTDQPVKKMQTYAEWLHDKYGKYEKKKTEKPTIRRSSTKKKEESAAGLLTRYARSTGKPKSK